MATALTETAQKPRLAPLDPSSLSKWHDPSKLRQRGGIFRPSHENPLIGLLLAIPKRSGRTPRRTPGSKKRKSTRAGSQSSDLDDGPSNTRYAPPSSPLGPKSTYKRKSIAASTQRKSLPEPSGDAEPIKGKRRRRTPSRRGGSESQEEAPAESSTTGFRFSGRIKLTELAQATSPPIIENPLVSSVQRRPLSPIAESSPPPPPPKLVLERPKAKKNELTAKVKKDKPASKPGKRKQPDTVVNDQDDELPSPPKRPRKDPSDAKTKKTTTTSQRAKPIAAPPRAFIIRFSDTEDDVLLLPKKDAKGKSKAAGEENATLKEKPIKQAAVESVPRVEDDASAREEKDDNVKVASSRKRSAPPKAGPKKPTATRKRKKIVPPSEPEDEADLEPIEVKKQPKKPASRKNVQDEVILVKDHDGPGKPNKLKKKKAAPAPRKSYFARAAPKSEDDEMDPLDLIGFRRR